MAVVMGWMMVAPATVWAVADDGCDDEVPSSTADQSPHQVATVGLTPAKTQPANSPCPVADYDSPSYNRCFIANPRPMSMMPQWITRRQAQDAVSLVLEEVYERHEYRSARRDSLPEPMWKMAPPAWLGDVIEALGQAQLPADPGSMCIEGSQGERCDNQPPSALLISTGSLTLIHHTPPSFDVPWQPDADELTQRALVDLRVGPSSEHRRLPERPPPLG